MAYSKIKKDGTPAKQVGGNMQLKASGKKVPIERFIQVTNDYVKECSDKKQVPLVQEMCLLLGISRETLSKYRKIRQYGDIIKRIDEITEIALLHKGMNENKPVFSMFLLKSKYNYIEAQYQKVDLHVSGLGSVVMPSKKPKVTG